MNVTLVLAASSVLLAGLAVLVAALVLRRAGRETETAASDPALPAAIDALRLEVRMSLDGTTQTLNQRIAQIGGEVDRRLGEVRGEVGNRLDAASALIGDRLEGAARAVADVHQKLGTVQGATERILEVGRDIASLQQILRAPKLRGGIGETFLGELLAQVLPHDAFVLQHGFRGGHRVDAVVRVGDRLVPVDAKFPLENFVKMAAALEEAGRQAARRAFVSDVRKRIDEIATRYILPDEGTFDFALMYVPAENVYYETIVRGEEGGGLNAIYEYALTRRVIPVSPNTFYSYLQVILLGLRGLRIEQSAHEILRGLAGLGGELNRFQQDFQVLGRHVGEADKKFAETARRLQKVQDALERLESLREPPSVPETPLLDGLENLGVVEGSTLRIRSASES